jgi:hypothetical protein
MDPSDEILAEFKRRLILSYDSKDFPVYTIVPNSVQFDYVLMNQSELTDDSAKDSNSYECTQLFDIVTFGGQRGSWRAANSLGTQIMRAIMKQDITTQNFKSTVAPIIDSTNHFIENVEGGLVMRKLIRFRYNLQQI